MTRKFSLLLAMALLIVLMVSAAGVYAQGPGGNGNGGNGGPNSDQCINYPADCDQSQQQYQQGNQNRGQNQQQNAAGSNLMGNQNRRGNQTGNATQNGQMGNGRMMSQGGNGIRVGANAVWTNEPVVTADEALALADEYVGDPYIVGEVIELESMFYVPIYDGATPMFELWINKETGVIMGIQTNQYGNQFMVDDSVLITQDAALVAATEVLEADQMLGDVIVFDDHYTFPVLENGVIVALLKVSAHSGNLYWYQ